MLSTIEIKRNSQFINSLIELYTNKIRIANFNFDPSNVTVLRKISKNIYVRNSLKPLHF